VTNALAIHTVRIEYDAGAGWKTIAAAAPQLGEFAWTVPDEVAAKARLRVVSSETGHADTSDGTFAIVPGTGIGTRSGAERGFALRVGGRRLDFPRWTGAAPERLEFLDPKGRVAFVIDVAKAGEARAEAGVYSVRPARGKERGAAIRVAWY
jgi:hypothetical protein